MTGQRETTRYATPTFTFEPEGQWLVRAQPWGVHVGWVERRPAGWTAMTRNIRYAGLWPTKQAAGEQLVKQAGYELEMG